MTVNREIRASDQDRERVVEALRTHYSDGRLNLEEFEERVTSAYGSKTLGDLLNLTTDLPGEVALGPSAAAAPDARKPAAGPARWLPAGLPLLVPILAAFLVVSSIAWATAGYHYHHHYTGFFPWPLLVFFVIFAGRARRGRRWYRNGPGSR